MSHDLEYERCEECYEAHIKGGSCASEGCSPPPAKIQSDESSGHEEDAVEAASRLRTTARELDERAAELERKAAELAERVAEVEKLVGGAKIIRLLPSDTLVIHGLDEGTRGSVPADAANSIRDMIGVNAVLLIDGPADFAVLRR